MAQLKGGTYVGGDFIVAGDIYCGGNLKAKQVKLTSAAITNIDFNTSDNFYILLNNSVTFTTTNAGSNIGKTGTIVIQENGTGGYVFTKPTEFKTPIGGASIVQTTAANSISVITYYIVSDSVILINYLGNFA